MCPRLSCHLPSAITFHVSLYLRQFLGDPRVGDLNLISKCLILNVIILPRRPKESAEGSVWDPNHPIEQIWYPSCNFHGRKGVLTGAYNFSKNAMHYGQMPNEKRLENAREGAARFGKDFAHGLRAGLSIAWQNMPYIKGGWARWQTLGTGDQAPVAVKAYNDLAGGTTVKDESNKSSTRNFFIIGDQVSSLPGWQEGAIAGALNALQLATYPDVPLPYLRVLPDPQLIVEGV